MSEVPLQWVPGSSRTDETFSKQMTNNELSGTQAAQPRPRPIQTLPGSVDRHGGYLAGKVDERLPEKGKSDSHGARPVHIIITMIKWIRTNRLSVKNSLSQTAWYSVSLSLSCPTCRSTQGRQANQTSDRSNHTMDADSAATTCEE